MLRTFHYSILITIPAFFYPSVWKDFLHLFPVIFQKIIISGELPFAIYFHYTSHLPVCSRIVPFACFRKWERCPEIHQTVFLCGIVELYVTHGFCQFPEKIRSGSFVVPYMGTRTFTRTETVHHTFPSHHMTAWQTKYCLRAQCG